MFFSCVFAALTYSSAPEDDTELTQNGIEFVLRIMTKNLHVLLQLQPPSSLEFFFYFTLRVLNGTEPLPKQAAAEFWVCFHLTSTSFHPRCSQGLMEVSSRALSFSNPKTQRRKAPSTTSWSLSGPCCRSPWSETLAAMHRAASSTNSAIR